MTQYDNMEAMVKDGYAPRTKQDAFNMGQPQQVTRNGDVARMGGYIFKVHRVTGKEQADFLSMFKPMPTPEDLTQGMNKLEAGKFDKPKKHHDGFLNAILGAVGFDIFSGKDRL